MSKTTISVFQLKCMLPPNVQQSVIITALHKTTTLIKKNIKIIRVKNGDTPKAKASNTPGNFIC